MDGMLMVDDVAETASDEPAALGGAPAKSLQMQGERNEAGQFLRGQSGNPAGRVPGTRNRATMIMEQLFDGASNDVSKKALADAMEGDGATLRLIIRSLIGPRRHRASSFSLPPLQNAADAAPAIAAIAAAASEGAISSAEACEMSRVVESYTRGLPPKRSRPVCSGWRALVASFNSPSLRRRLDALTEAVRRDIEHRENLRDRVRAGNAIRAALAAAKIDPATVQSFRAVASAEAKLSQMGEGPELQRADAAFIARDPKLAARESDIERWARRAARFADRSAPDPGATLDDWYAWSLAARPGRSDDRA